MNRSRALLAILWCSFLLIHLALSTFLYLDQGIEADNYKKLLIELNTSFAPYLGAILIFYWTRRADQGAVPKRNEDRLALRLACGCTLIWNLLMLVLVARLVFRTGTIEDTIERMADFRGLFSWLVAGSIGFYFGSSR